MNNLVVEDYHDLLTEISKDFARKNKRSNFSAEDYYQQGVVILMELDLSKYDPELSDLKSYISSSIKNRLKNYIYDKGAKLAKTGAIFPLLIKIKKLENQGYTLEDILNELNITYEKYVLAHSIMSEINLNKCQPGYFQDYDTNVNIQDIINNLNDEGLYIFLSLLNDDSIKKMSQQTEITYEGMRKKVNKYRKIFKEIYDE